MSQLEHIEAIENRLWSSADNLRANSNYASNEYFLPVMGLIFLRHAYSRYLAIKDAIEANLPTRGGKARSLAKEDFSKKSAIFLRSETQFDSNVPERTRCMEALFNKQPSDPTGQPESVRNIITRYQDIEQHFPEELANHALPYFANWLIENVHLVEISAYSDEDAYTIFETMNDQGLSLSQLDMLKGFVLANIADE